MPVLRTFDSRWSPLLAGRRTRQTVECVGRVHLGALTKSDTRIVAASVADACGVLATLFLDANVTNPTPIWTTELLTVTGEPLVIPEWLAVVRYRACPDAGLTHEQQISYAHVRSFVGFHEYVLRVVEKQARSYTIVSVQMTRTPRPSEDDRGVSRSG